MNKVKHVNAASSCEGITQILILTEFKPHVFLKIKCADDILSVPDAT